MTFYTDYHQDQFKARVSKALSSVRRVLDVERSEKLRIADDVDHKYQDKYKLTDLMTNMAIVSFVSVLKELGLTKEILQSIDMSKETTLRFSTTEMCTFVNEEVVDEPLPFSKVTEETTTQVEKSGSKPSPIGQLARIVKGPVSEKSTVETIVKRVLKQTYKIEKDWELSIYSGTDVENRTILQERKGAFCEYVRELSPDQKNKSKSSPFPPKKEHRPIELSLTWLLQQIDPVELKSHFAIDTTPGSQETKTPVHNAQMDKVRSFFHSMRYWASQVENNFSYTYRSFKTKDSTGMMALKERVKDRADAIFIPIMPLMVDQKPKDGQNGEEDWEETGPSSMDIQPESSTMVALPSADIANESEQAILSKSDTTSFLNEHTRTLSGIIGGTEEEFVDLGVTCDLLSPQEYKMLVLFVHLQLLYDQCTESIRYVDKMLKSQLVAAIGKEVSKRDIDSFMRYHNDKLFNPSPKRFCHTIRRPEHYPDGILSIEEIVHHDGKEEVESISTHVRSIVSEEPTRVPLNAATTISLTGKTNLHGWLNHRFEDRYRSSVRLNARARQFSSFVLLVGTMTNQNQLQPKDAIILRNKDEVHIPLILNEIPTSKEFKDAIGSLSPEQQRFAKSFRSMQLESSVLGVCVIQIKPQLEHLLGLPADSLTKEMKLTEDLTELFIEYQVPSDLVSCDLMGDYDASDAIENVRVHVKSVMDVIQAQKKEELEEQKRVAEMAKARKNYDSSSCEECAPPGSFYGMSDEEECGFAYAEEAECAMIRSAPPPKVRIAAKGFSAPMAGGMPRGDGMRRSLKSMSNTPSTADRRVEQSETELVEQETIVFATMPKVLNKAIELHDKNASIRSTTIGIGKDWTRNRQKNLLSKPETSSLEESEIASEKARAFDLLDALSRSGSLEIPFSELHVMICATHSFEKNVMDTVIKDNVNPIEKLEMSTLLMASTILGVPARDLIRHGEDLQRLENSFPLLLCNGAEDQETDVVDTDAIDTDIIDS